MRRNIWERVEGKLTLDFHPGQTAAWDSERRFVFVIAGTQSGKCLHPDSLVLLADGTRRRMAEMQVGDVVCCLGDDLKITTSPVTAVLQNGVQALYRVTTSSGRQIRVTAEHPLYGVRGWQPAGEFQAGDWIGVPRCLPDGGRQTDTPERMKVLGYLLGDGGTTGTSVLFSNIDAEVMDDLRSALPSPCQLVHSDRCTWRITGYGRGSSSINPVQDWCRAWGLSGVLAKHKRIPEFVFGLKRDSIAPMLNALFACDGWIDGRGFGFASASEGLVEDVRHLLLRFGIRGRVRYKLVKLNKKLFDSWSLAVHDATELGILAREIGIVSKQAKLEARIAAKAGQRANSKDVIPNYDLAACYTLLGKPHHSRKGGYEDAVGYALVRQARHAAVSRTLAQQLANYFGVDRDNAYSDVQWDTVSSIEPMGDSEVWDITVRDGHNFIADDVFAHNTSFGPWWLWREIMRVGSGDYLAVTSSFDLFKLKMLPEMRNVFEHLLGLGRYWAGDGVLEIRDPESGKFWAQRADDPMWARVILRSAQAGGGLESSSAGGAWLDECGQDAFTLDTWEAVLRRLSLSRGRVLATTTPYNLGWMKQNIVDQQHRDTDIDVINFPSIYNPAFSKDEFADRERKMTKPKFDMFYRGLFTRPLGMVYADYVDELRDAGGHVVEPFEIPATWPRYVGVDPGAVNTAMVWLAHDVTANVYYLYRESLEGGKSTAGHAQGAQALATAGNERVVLWYVGQKAEVQVRLDWQAAGIWNVREPSVHDVEAGIDRVTTLLKERRLYVFETCRGVRDEIGRYVRVVDEQGEATEKIAHKDTFHRLDAVRYAAVGVSTPVGVGLG